MVPPEGFEPPTPGSEDQCSIQLSYDGMKKRTQATKVFYHTLISVLLLGVRNLAIDHHLAGIFGIFRGRP
ncbi:MAG: hypothetical protein UY05_C0009G0014 [Candidatus Peregrinibacteria bacterium GW2011_GWA2_47_7]|nr:MAG: hypothetical protein UY05_C0009G0014 [Candidatus Peregrinibacteria bacterium GW2011_GWA2_47_7]